MALTDKQRAQRNLNPHAEAIYAMRRWGYEYGHEQRGGSMDFWDNLSDERKRLCVEAIDAIDKALKAKRRAPTLRVVARV